MSKRLRAIGKSKLLDTVPIFEYNDTISEPLWNEEMPAITVKNIPPELYERLKKSAEANHRSINSEIIVCIERAVRSRTLSLETTLSRARNLRERTVAYRITDDEFTQAKAEGRL